MSLIRYLPTPSDRMGILWSLLCVEGSVVLEYGPAGTTHYSMGLFGELGIKQQNRLFTTHMSEDDVVLGDVKRLERAIVELDEAQQPQVIFVVASSVSACIGTDLRGVCAYMQEKTRARLIAFEQGGFRGDYSVGLREAYQILVKELVEPAEKQACTYNILGASIGEYRAASDVNEIRQLMNEAFGMTCHTALCVDTSVEKIRACGSATVNLVLREEALPSARLLQERFGIPYVLGAPYGYAGTAEWLCRVGETVGRMIEPSLTHLLKKRGMAAAQYRMYGRMLKEHKPAVTLYGEYATVQGLAGLMAEIGFPVLNKVCAHGLRVVENPAEDVKYLPVEKERVALYKSLHHQLVLADDIAAHLIAPDNTFLRIATPLVDGTQIATHLPIMGYRGADWLLETVETYLSTLK